MLAKQAKAADAGGLLPPVARTGRHLLASRHAHPHLRLPRARSLDPRVSAVHRHNDDVRSETGDAENNVGENHQQRRDEVESQGIVHPRRLTEPVPR